MYPQQGYPNANENRNYPANQGYQNSNLNQYPNTYTNPNQNYQNQYISSQAAYHGANERLHEG
jgi:hypothetical protein